MILLLENELWSEMDWKGFEELNRMKSHRIMFLYLEHIIRQAWC